MSVHPFSNTLGGANQYLVHVHLVHGVRGEQDQGAAEHSCTQVVRRSIPSPKINFLPLYMFLVSLSFVLEACSLFIFVAFLLVGRVRVTATPASRLTWERDDLTSDRRIASITPMIV